MKSLHLKNNRKTILICITANAIIIVIYFLIWMLFHFFWMKQKIPHPKYWYWTLPVIIFFVNNRFISEEKKPIKYLKVSFATVLSCTIWMWLIWFLGVVFHWHLGGRL